MRYPTLNDVADPYRQTCPECGRRKQDCLCCPECGQRWCVCEPEEEEDDMELPWKCEHCGAIEERGALMLRCCRFCGALTCEECLTPAPVSRVRVCPLCVDRERAWGDTLPYLLRPQAPGVGREA